MDNTKKILISSCFLLNTRYDGNNSQDNEIRGFLDFLDKHGFILIPACPEQLGGLMTPRPPAEISDDRVVNTLKEDVTDYFIKGAEETLNLTKFFDIKLAFLKQKSPSCGYGKIYDGNFNRKIIRGNGLTANLLEKNNITIFTEEDISNRNYINRLLNLD